MSLNRFSEILDEQFEIVWKSFEADQDMQDLQHVIKIGHGPGATQTYYCFRDTLTQQDRIILKRERIMVPNVLKT